MRVLFLATAVAALAGAQSAPDPQKLFGEALQAQQHGDDATAIRVYGDLLKTYPNMAELHTNLGAVLAHSGKLPEAIAQYRAALKLTPDNQAVRLNLALAYLKGTDWKNAAAELSSLHAKQPQDMRTALLLADADLHLDSPQAAIAILKPLEDAQAGNIDLERLLTDALLRTGQSREALKRLHGLAAATSDPALYTLSARTALKTNQFEVVKKDADAALALNPETPDAWTLKGEALSYLLDNQGALEALQNAVKQNPESFDAQLALGSLQSVMHDLPGAEAHLKKALQLNAESSVAHYEYAKVENGSGHSEAALADFLKATAADPNWLPPHVSLAAVYAKLHRGDDARRERELVDKLRAVEQKNEVDMVSRPAP